MKILTSLLTGSTRRPMGRTSSLRPAVCSVGLFRLSRFALEQMRGRGGVILNLASIYSFIGAQVSVAYSTSLAGGSGAISLNPGLYALSRADFPRVATDDLRRSPGRSE